MIQLDNFLPASYNKMLYDLFLSNSFPWYYSKQTSNYSLNDNRKDIFLNEHVQENPQYVHVFFYETKTSSWFDLVSPVVLMLQKELNKNLKLIRIKANMVSSNPNYPDECYNTPHIDWSPTDINSVQNYRSFLYYVNDSDGDTFIFNEKWKDSPSTLTIKQRQTPKANSGLFFDSQTYHASSPPRNTKERLVINYVMEELDV